MVKIIEGKINQTQNELDDFINLELKATTQVNSNDKTQ